MSARKQASVNHELERDLESTTEQFIKEKALREEAEFKVAALAVEIESADQMIDSLELALMRATEDVLEAVKSSDNPEIVSHVLQNLAAAEMQTKSFALEVKEEREKRQNAEQSLLVVNSKLEALLQRLQRAEDRALSTEERLNSNQKSHLEQLSEIELCTEKRIETIEKKWTARAEEWMDRSSSFIEADQLAKAKEEELSTKITELEHKLMVQSQALEEAEKFQNKATEERLTNENREAEFAACAAGWENECRKMEVAIAHASRDSFSEVMRLKAEVAGYQRVVMEKDEKIEELKAKLEKKIEI